MKSLFFFSIMTNGDSDYTPIDKEEYIMATWKNLDTLSSYDKLSGLKNHVDIATAMSGEQGGERVKNYSTPMAAGLQYNYAAKEVDETVLTALAELADEAQLIDKFEELYNGAVINTGEKRMVLHHLARTQLGNPVVVDGVDKREFYVAQQKKAADFAVNNISKMYKLYENPMDRLKESLGLTRKKRYKEHYALNNVSFQVKKGETVGIIGTNGSGKSTILKIITGVLNPTQGEVVVDGRISALLELGAGFNGEYSGIENVYLNGQMIGFSKEEIDAKLQDILDFADIGDFIHQPVKTYSSGMFVAALFKGQ